MYEKSEKLRALGEKVIAEHPDLFGFIPELGIEIAYLSCDEKKVKPGMRVNAEAGAGSGSDSRAEKAGCCTSTSRSTQRAP